MAVLIAIKDVDEQIAYKPIRAAVNEELRAHVEDKAETYMEYGIPLPPEASEEAWPCSSPSSFYP